MGIVMKEEESINCQESDTPTGGGQKCATLKSLGLFRVLGRGWGSDQ